MGDIAEACGISRQALYLHFTSRADLMIATIRYVDEASGLNDRLERAHESKTAIEFLEQSVEIWGNYMPEVYGLAKAMLRARDTDDAMAAAWNDSMRCLRDACREIVGALDREGILAAQWSPEDAVDMLYTLLSFANWEQLTEEAGWTTSEYVKQMKMMLRRVLVDLG